MIRRRSRAGALGAVVAVALGAAASVAQVLPAGWRSVPAVGSPAGSGVRQFEALGLPDGEFAIVEQSPRTRPDGRSLREWLDASAAADRAPAGAWTAEAPLAQSQSAGIVTTSRVFAVPGGRGGVAIYFAAGAAGEPVRRIRVSFSSPAVARGPQAAAARELVATLLREPAPAPTRAPAPAQTPAPSTGPTPAPADFRFVTAPGAGLRPEQVETVFYHWDQRFDAFQGLTLDEDAYLLLKDGTAYAGLPVPPQDFDVAASRRQEPQHWGRWHRAGDAYEFAWATAPDRYRAERGNAVDALRPGAALDGRYAGASSYVLPGGGVTTWSERRVRLSPDGRFEIDRSGGAGVSDGGGDARTVTVYDNERSASSTVSSTIAGGRAVDGPDNSPR